VDEDADLDVVVPAVISSAFGFAGQKCSAASRLIAVGGVADALLERLAGATELVTVGPVVDLATTCGPVVEEEAMRRYADAMAEAARVGAVRAVCADTPGGGWFAAPAVVEVPTDSRLWTDELFVPLLAFTRADSLDDALALANDSPYALTAGYFGRLPSRLARAAGTLRAGNVYVNRPTTGAVVGRQPFGGQGMSGVGSKAGGPDYLVQFCDPRVVSENTMRQGFAPELW
jgi:RHH-type proline utilization regulon transcriptional repressor/proline dehydrogenase/delta 1-pyrroline-5-carboxylate dehydrogenase